MDFLMVSQTLELYKADKKLSTVKIARVIKPHFIGKQQQQRPLSIT
jgi:hypothetical protein